MFLFIKVIKHQKCFSLTRHMFSTEINIHQSPTQVVERIVVNDSFSSKRIRTVAWEPLLHILWQKNVLDNAYNKSISETNGINIWVNQATGVL